MKLRDKREKTGHLLAFISKARKEDNFYLFFPVAGLDQFESLLKVTQGFRKSFESNKSLKDNYDFIGYSVADFNSVEDVFPKIDRTRIFRFDLEEFLTRSANNMLDGKDIHDAQDIKDIHDTPDAHDMKNLKDMSEVKGSKDGKDTQDVRFIDDFAEVLLQRLIKRKSPVFPTILTGAMATGTHFYNREDEIQDIRTRLQNGKNLLLRAPRRYGKSSLLNHLSQNSPAGWHTCYIDLEGGKSPQDFVEEILKGITDNKKCLSCLQDSHLLKKLRVESEDSNEVFRKERREINKNWKEYAEKLFSSMNNYGGEFLLILDEVSFLLEDMICEFKDEGMNNINEFLRWFRGIRDRFNNISFIISGSEHLPAFLESYAINGLLDDLETVQLKLFSTKMAGEFIFLTLAGKAIVVSIDEIEQILDLMGEPIPYFLQLFLDALSRVCSEGKDVASHEIKDIYYRELLGPESKRYFESIYRQMDRYSRYGTGHRKGAEMLLNTLAGSDVPIDKKHLEGLWQHETGETDTFKVMCSILQDDFYLAEQDGRFFLNSKLLKEWWLRHVLP